MSNHAQITTPMPERSDLRALVRMLWRWKLLFVAVLVIPPLVAYAVVRNKAKVYQSSALISVSAASVSAGGGSGSFSTTNLDAIARLISTTPIATIAAKELRPPGNPGELAGEVSASADPTTNFLTITAQANNPRRAANVANAFAVALGTNQTNQAIGQINAQIATLQRQLAAIPNTAVNAPSRQQLQAQISQLQAQRGSQGHNVSVIQAAAPNSTPVSPHVRRTVELGLVIGVLLAIGAVALAENADRRLRSPSDLEQFTTLPLLSAIPRKAFGAPVDSTGPEDEAFQMLRSALTYFNVDRRLKTVVLTSAGQRDGKTTVAVRLAIAAARAGKRVILVDADLRRHQVNERLGIRTRVGLGDVLVGETPLADALIEYRVESSKGGTLEVLAAGPPPPNPAELLSSREMSRVLAELEMRSDLVVIDTPAALAVSDTMPLLQMASGIVLVARMNRTTRDQIRRLQRLIVGVNGELVGLVATGIGGGPGYDEYEYGYYGTGEHRGGLRALLRRRRRSLTYREPSAAQETQVTRPASELTDVKY